MAPASNVKCGDLEAVARLCSERATGHYFDSILDDLLSRDRWNAGRAELKAMFVREDVKAIVCARGCTAQLFAGSLGPGKDQGASEDVGYSDLTTLLTHFSDAIGFGDLPRADDDERLRMTMASTSASWHAALTGSAPGNSIRTGVSGLVEGAAEGILYGGCLSILAASLGTRYEIKTAGSILFLEDVAAKPYQIDRMLMQLKLAGKVQRCAALSSARCEIACKPEWVHAGRSGIASIVGKLGVPVAYGVRSGHVTAGI